MQVSKLYTSETQRIIMNERHTFKALFRKKYVQDSNEICAQYRRSPNSLNGTYQISMWLPNGDLLVSKWLIRLTANTGHMLCGGVGYSS